MAVPARRAEHLQRPRRLAPVPPRRPRRRRHLPFLLMAATVITAMVMALTTAQALVSQSSFRMSELSRQVERLEADSARLRLQIARLTSLDRIERSAQQAGLVPPGRMELLVVSETGT